MPTTQLFNHITYLKGWHMNNNPNSQLENHIKIEDFELKSNIDIVMSLVDCYPSNPTYEGIVEEYKALEQETRDLVEPVALLQFEEIKDPLNIDGYPKGTPACYVFFTIGDKIKDVSRGYFDKGDYLSGMLVNAIADDYLFQVDDELKNKLEVICREKGIGVTKRLDVPDEIPMEAQKVVLETTMADAMLDISITEGFMFTIVKSNCYILILSDNPEIMNAGHDCSKCSLKNCKLRKIKNTV